jgi:hypothetical protein
MISADKYDLFTERKLGLGKLGPPNGEVGWFLVKIRFDHDGSILILWAREK